MVSHCFRVGERFRRGGTLIPWLWTRSFPKSDSHLACWFERAAPPKRPEGRADQGAKHIEETPFAMQHSQTPLSGSQTYGPLHQRLWPGTAAASVEPESRKPASAMQRTVKSGGPETIVWGASGAASGAARQALPATHCPCRQHGANSAGQLQGNSCTAPEPRGVLATSALNCARAVALIADPPHKHPATQ